MTNYEKELLTMLEEKFSSGEYHYTFDLPSTTEETNKLCTALKSLEASEHIMILESPEYTDDDFIEVEKFPPCCKNPDSLA
ncbi:MAG: hypothetical protein LKJ25_05985 [Clostridia bacterium]|jgi:hypothetical protein|nr:hypothetical protein [Clostridia bacterium]